MNRLAHSAPLSAVFALSVGMAYAPSALAQPPAGKAVPAPLPAPASAEATPATGTTPTNGAAQTLSVPGRNLMSQRLHPASFPSEAEVRCNRIAAANCPCK